MNKWMPNDRSVSFENLTNSIGVLVVAGPKARKLMQKVSPSSHFSMKLFHGFRQKKLMSIWPLQLLLE